MSGPKVLVTGAGGFIGGWMAEALHLMGWDVRAGVGRWSSAARIGRFPFEIVHCDVTQGASLDAALSGVEVVIHCARGKIDDVVVEGSVTLGGTRLLLERARAAGVRHVVHLSSAAVYGETLGVVHEDTPVAGELSVYGQGKRAAELACEQLADDRMRVSVIRPTLVYGPFSEQWSTPYITRFRSGRWRKLGARGEGKANLVYVGDLVHQAVFLIENDLGPFVLVNGNGPDTPTWNEYLEGFNAALGNAPLAEPAEAALGLQVALRRPVRILGKYLLANHRELLMFAARNAPPLKRAMKAAEADLKLNPNDDEMKRFGEDVVYSMDRSRALGFTPRTSTADGLALTADWARFIGLA